MQKILSLVLLVTAYCFLPPCISAQESALEREKAIRVNATYMGDVVTNISGGLKKGTRYLGLANFRAGISTEGLRLWKGGKLFINVANAHGGDPSADLIGDFHIISNIETGDLTWLHELWYKQSFGNLEFTVGVQDLNSEFLMTGNGSIFLNSTFGTPSTIASNVPSPIFPLTAIGASVKIDFPERNTVKLAFFDGLPTSFIDNPHNLRWTLSEKDGIFGIAEFARTGNILLKDGTYKAGIYYHSRNPSPDNDILPRGKANYNSGFYLIADQNIWKEPHGKGEISFFAQIAASPRKINIHYFYAGAGLTFKGFIPGRGDDIAGIAWNRTTMNGHATGNESNIELSYKALLGRNIFIQPDLQYVINPGGTDHPLDNAFAGLVRFGMEF